MPVLRIAVVDGRTVEREGISSILSRDPEVSVVATFRSAEALFAAVDGVMPDVIVLDEALPGMSGSLACLRAAQERPKCRSVLISDDDRDRAGVDGSNVGADRVIPRSVSARELAAAVWETAGQARRAPAPANRLAIRAARERAVLRLVAQGSTNDQIARVLRVSVGTIKTDLRGVMKQLGVRDRAHAVAEAIR